MTVSLRAAFRLLAMQAGAAGVPLRSRPSVLLAGRSGGARLQQLPRLRPAVSCRLAAPASGRPLHVCSATYGQGDAAPSAAAEGAEAALAQSAAGPAQTEATPATSGKPSPFAALGVRVSSSTGG